MQIEALNCPNCGAGVFSDAVQCKFCKSRLKTMACPACLGLMFQGSEHCPKCGEKAVKAEVLSGDKLGDCPRCKVRLSLLQIGSVNLRECERCDGVWADAKTFENICADRESNASVMQWANAKNQPVEKKDKIQYIPCPDCKTLMNRSNFARSSGIVLDICKQHGLWFDSDELPQIIEFIHDGGLDRARQKEKMQLEEDVRDLRQKEYIRSLDKSSFGASAKNWDKGVAASVRDFVRILFD